MTDVGAQTGNGVTHETVGTGEITVYGNGAPITPVGTTDGVATIMTVLSPGTVATKLNGT
jgi:hypothetical protein